MTIARQATFAAAGLVVLAVLPGCETTADKSARLAAQAQTSKQETGLRVTSLNPDVKVLERTAITDANGTAVVVTLRDTARVALADVPIAIDVRSATGKSLFRNDQPGAEAALVSAPLLSPGDDFDWVHDQVMATGEKPADVTVRVGKPRATSSARPPRLHVGRLTVQSDGEDQRVRGAGRAGEPRMTGQQPTFAVPLLGAEGERCGQCRAPLGVDQRYCLNCGRRRAAPRRAAADGSVATGAPASELERRRAELAGLLAELQSDLGGLTYEMAIRDHFRLDVLLRGAAELQRVDDELAEVERSLAPASAGGTL